MRKPEEIAQAFSITDSLDGVRTFFLVGIGGAGMSALARMLKTRGYEVLGTDSGESPETERLRAEGISVSIGHSGDGIQPGMAVVLTDAIDLTVSPEYAAAQRLGLAIVRRSQALGWLLRDYKVIAVTGTHGKTTTTGLIGAGMIAAGMDPLVVVGASIGQWKGPVHEGKGEWAVVEACEAYDSFHDIQPFLVVLTNLELDHVDFHGSFENLRKSVLRFVESVPETGGLVYCAEDRGASEIAELSSVNALPYGNSSSWIRQLSNKLNLGLEGEYTVGIRTEMALPGEHNKLNATAALMVAEFLQKVGADIDSESFANGVFRFGGAERRLQVLLESPVTVIDDYAHHPTEIQASLKAVRQRYFEEDEREGRLIVVYQPHLYSRTAPLISEFAEALSLADLVVLTDIYPAREAPMPGVSSSRIAELVQKDVLYVPSRHLLPRKVCEVLRPGDVVVGMGAGNISEFAPSLIKEIQRADPKNPPAKGLKVAVFFGGDSAEREVSLHSGIAIHAALERLGHKPFLVDATEVLLSRGDLKGFVGAERPDAVFLAVHGTHAEDGAIQGLLELLHIPYTGSGIQASAMCMDKARTKEILERHGVRTPRGVLLHSPEDELDLLPPLIVKPNAQGSTVGLSFVESIEDVELAIRRAFAYDTSVLVEEWIQGMEISTPVLVDHALLPVEIAPTSGRYDFESKYTPGATMEIVPARLEAEVLKRAQEIALQAHFALGCTGATRTDAIVRDGEIFVLEVNTLPGMTGTSLLPNSALASGVSFDELCQSLLMDALKTYAAKA